MKHLLSYMLIATILLFVTLSTVKAFGLNQYQGIVLGMVAGELWLWFCQHLEVES